MSLPPISPAKPSAAAPATQPFRRSVAATAALGPSSPSAPSAPSPTKPFDRFVVDDIIRHKGKTGHQAYLIELERQQNNGFLRCERPIGLIDHSVTKQAAKRPQNQGHFTFSLKNISIYTLCFLFVFTVKMKRLLGRKTAHEQMVEFTAKVEKLKAHKAAALEFQGTTKIAARQKMQLAWRRANDAVRERVAASHRRALVAKAFHVPSLPKSLTGEPRTTTIQEELPAASSSILTSGGENSARKDRARMLSLGEGAPGGGTLARSLELSLADIAAVAEERDDHVDDTNDTPFSPSTADVSNKTFADALPSSNNNLTKEQTPVTSFRHQPPQHPSAVAIGKSGRIRTFPLASILFPESAEDADHARHAPSDADDEADNGEQQQPRLRRRSDITSSLSLKKQTAIVNPRPRDRNAFVMNTDWEEAPFIPLTERCKPVDRPQSYVKPSSLFQFTKTKIPNFISMPGISRPPDNALAPSTTLCKDPSVMIDPYTFVRSKNARSGADYGPACRNIAPIVKPSYNFREWRGAQQAAIQAFLMSDLYYLGKELVEHANDPSNSDSKVVERIEQQMEQRREELEKLRVLGHSPEYNFDDSAAQTHDKFEIVLKNEEIAFFENVGAEYVRLVQQKHSVVLPAKRGKLLYGVVSHPDWRAHMRKIHADCAAKVKHEQLCEARKYNANWVQVLRAQILDSIVDPTPLEKRVFDVTLECVHRVGRDSLNMQDFARHVLSQFDHEELSDMNVQFILERHLPLFGGSVDDLKALLAEKAVQYFLLERKDWEERRAFVSASDKEQTAMHELRRINSVVKINAQIVPQLEAQMHLAATEAENRVRKAREEAAANRRASMNALNNGGRRKMSRITQADAAAVLQ